MHIFFFNYVLVIANTFFAPHPICIIVLYNSLLILLLSINIFNEEFDYIFFNKIFIYQMSNMLIYFVKTF